jgi:hypothetical protein
MSSFDYERRHDLMTGGITRRSVLQSAASAVLVSSLGRVSSLAAQSLSYDYYISPNGSDSNSGTQTQPWAITALTTKTSLIAGKRIGLLSGTYVVPRTYTDNWGGNVSHYGIRISAAGTPSAPTTVESVTPRGAILQPAGDVSTGLIAVEAPYVHLRNITLNAQRMTAVWARGNYFLCEGVDFGPASPSWDDNFGVVYFKAANDPNKVLSPVFRNCLFRGVYQGGGTSYGWNSAAFFGFSVKDILIERCTFDNVYNPFRTKYDWQGFTFRYNYLRTNCKSAMGSLTDPVEFPNETPVYHNNVCVFWGVNSDYIGNGSGAGEIFSNAHVYNNTFIRAGGSSIDHGMFRWYLTTQYSRQARFYNNICHTTSPISGAFYLHALIRAEGSGSHFTSNFAGMDYNAYPNDAAGYFSARTAGPDFYTSATTYASLASWRTASGFDAASIQANPLFTGTGTGAQQYQLQSGSPCRNAGRVGGVAGGAVVDIGAWGGNVAGIGHYFEAGPVPMPVTITVE